MAPTVGRVPRGSSCPRLPLLMTLNGYELTAPVRLMLASAGFLLLLAALLWRRRDVRGALPLAIQALLVAALCISLALETAATGAAARQFWFLTRSALILPGGIVILWFALEYASFERWLSRPVIALLVGSVVLHLLLYLPAGGTLIWSRVWWAGEVRATPAPLGALFTAYAFALFLLASAILLLLFVRSPAHRAPVALLLAGQVAARLVYPMATLKLVELPNAATVLVFDFAGLMYALALLRLRLFDLVPVARETILARMPDPLLVLDAGGRIADLNEAALRLLGGERRAALGRPAVAALAAAPELAGAVAASAPARGEAAYATPEGTCTCEVSSTPLADWQGQPIGRLVLFHDITALRRVEAQLVEQERALAAAQERERLARELHDGLAQDLWLAKLKATRLGAQHDLAPEARVLSDELTAALDAGIAEARQALATMRAAGEPPADLRARLARALDEVEDRFGLAVEFDCAADLPALPSRAEAETLRIVGEALTNVRRHADATVVRVRGGSEAGGLVLEIRDNGCGFDPGLVGQGTYGLAGMRERAAQIGAQLEIESAPRQGTRVRLRVPAAGAAPVEGAPA